MKKKIISGSLAVLLSSTIIAAPSSAAVPNNVMSGIGLKDYATNYWLRLADTVNEHDNNLMISYDHVIDRGIRYNHNIEILWLQKEMLEEMETRLSGEEELDLDSIIDSVLDNLNNRDPDSTNPDTGNGDETDTNPGNGDETDPNTGNDEDTDSDADNTQDPENDQDNDSEIEGSMLRTVSVEGEVGEPGSDDDGNENGDEPGSGDDDNGNGGEPGNDDDDNGNGGEPGSDDDDNENGDEPESGDDDKDNEAPGRDISREELEAVLKPFIEMQNESIEEQRKQVKLELDKWNYTFSDALEGTRLQLTGKYIEVLALEEGLALRNSHLNNLKDNLKQMQVSEEVGLASSHDLRTLQRQVEMQEREYELQKDELRVAKQGLAQDLGYARGRDFKLVPPTDNQMKRVVKNYDIDRMISGSNAISVLELDLEAAEVEDEEGPNYQEDIIEEQIKMTRKDLEQKIRTLYVEEEKNYQAMLDQRELLAAEWREVRKISLEYELGLVSRVEYESETASLREAQFNHLNAQSTYLLTKQQIEAAKRGFIQ